MSLSKTTPHEQKHEEGLNSLKLKIHTNQRSVLLHTLHVDNHMILGRDEICEKHYFFPWIISRSEHRLI